MTEKAGNRYRRQEHSTRATGSSGTLGASRKSRVDGKTPRDDGLPAFRAIPKFAFADTLQSLLDGSSPRCPSALYGLGHGLHLHRIDPGKPPDALLFKLDRRTPGRVFRRLPIDLVEFRLEAGSEVTNQVWGATVVHLPMETAASGKIKK